MVDLHAHSSASDGTLSPAELVELAASEGLTALALTDHDTVAGLDEAMEAAARRSIGFVPGIELEIEFESGVFHLLGLGLGSWRGAVRERLEFALTFRKERNLEMVALLRQAGLPITYEELAAIAGHDTVGRPHFARWLVEHGAVRSFQEAFDTMLGEGRPYYRRKQGLSVGRTCDIVHEAGGLALVAHPQSLRMNWDDLEKSLKRWKGEGLDGVEAYHSGLGCADAARIAGIAKRLDLVVSAGSDFHGPLLADKRLGHSCEDTEIDDDFLKPFGVITNGVP